MTTQKKGKLIGKIVEALKIQALAIENKSFCEGDVFFSLAFKSDSELLKIAKLSGVA